MKTKDKKNCLPLQGKKKKDTREVIAADPTDVMMGKVRPRKIRTINKKK